MSKRSEVSEEIACTESLCHSVEQALERYFEHLNGEPPAGLYQMVIAEVERPLLEKVMQYTEGNQSQAAKLLGINRNTLRSKLQSHKFI